MAHRQQQLAVPPLRLGPVGLGGGGWGEAGHGLHQFFDIGVVEDLAIGGLDAFDEVLR